MKSTQKRPFEDDRDISLGLRYRFAQLVACKISGVEEAVPENSDYVIADKIMELVEKEALR